MNAHVLSRVLSQAVHLSDAELVAQVKRLAQQEREATSVLIAHLAVLDERRLYLTEGCSSLFTYCTQVLHLSEHAAYGRIEAARAARKFPVILERLADGSVNLTTVCLLAPHLTAENHEALLRETRHQSKRQVEELVAHLRPQPPVSSTTRRLPIARDAAGTAPTDQNQAEVVGLNLDSMHLALSAAAAPSPPPASGALPLSRRPVIEPSAPEQYRVQFTATAETYERIRLAQDLLRHQIPDGDVGKVIDLALTALLKDLGKQKHAATEHPREAGRSAKPSRSRHIPAEVKRAVWKRDSGRCAFVGLNGRRCTERGFLEFHHVVPYAAGGEATADNIQLRCRAHNGYEADRFFSAGPAIVRESPAHYTPAGLLSVSASRWMVSAEENARNSVQTELG